MRQSQITDDSQAQPQISTYTAISQLIWGTTPQQEPAPEKISTEEMKSGNVTNNRYVQEACLMQKRSKSRVT